MSVVFQNIPSVSRPKIKPVVSKGNTNKKASKKMARQKSDSYKRTVSFYNDNFELVEKPVEGTITVAKTKSEAFDLFDNDDQKITDALNAQAREIQIKNAVASVTGGLEERFILGFIKPMRLTEPFSQMPNETAADEKKIVAAILEQVKAVPFLLNSLKSYCKTRAAEGDDSAE